MANIFNAFQRDHRWLRPLLRQLRHHLCLHLGRLVTLALGLSRVRTVAWRHHVRHPLLARDADLARAQRKDCPSREGREIFSFVITSLRQPTLRPVFLASLNKTDIIRFDIESLPKFISNPWFNFHKKSVLKWPRLSLSEVCHFKKLFGTLSKIYDCYLFLNATEYQFTCALR